MTHAALTPQQERLTSAGLAAYREIAVGKRSWIYLVGYEVATLLFSNVPGLLGYGSRAVVYPWLLGSSGSKPAFGRGIVLRNPACISLGNRVLVDDYAVLDAREENGSIRIGDRASIGRFTTLAAKNGSITLASGVNIGSYCRVATQSRIEIGESVLIAAFSYIGPGNHQAGDPDTPLISRPMEIRGGVTIGAHAWIGAHVTILDGVSVGARAIVGAHSLVRENVPEGAIVAGAPARQIGNV